MSAALRWRAHKLGVPYAPPRRLSGDAVASYEYAGFQFVIERDGDGHIAVAAPGQHPAAYKDRHARAALECWRQDGRPT